MPSTYDDLRVLVVAEDHLARAGLAALLADQPGCSIAGQITPQDASGGPDVYRADVAVWDVGWDAANTLEQMAGARDAGPPVIALVPDESAVAASWNAGARGILPRDLDGAVLRDAIAVVEKGLAVLDPELANTMVAATGPPLAPPEVDLTPRELDVLGLMAEGLANKTIAERLTISEHTVKFHVNAILSKLAAQSRTEAVTRAMRLGLITL